MRVKAVVALGVLAMVLTSAALVICVTPSRAGRVVPRLTRVPAGLEARFDPQGFLLLRAHTEASIRGYEDEPYLELSSTVVRENQASLSAWMNHQLYPKGTPPTTVPGGGPRWVIIDRQGRVRFHDHRAHWMAASLPDGARPGEVLTRFEIPVQIQGQDRDIQGELVLEGPERAGGAVIGLLVLGALAAAAGVVVLWTRPRPRAEPAAGDLESEPAPVGDDAEHA